MISGVRSAFTLYAAEPVHHPQSIDGWKTIAVKPGCTTTPIEASGLWYDFRQNVYYLVSDETDYKEPVLFTMDTNAVVRTRVPVAGISEVNDLEGVTVGPEGHWYLLTSQSYNKKGKLPASRTLLLECEATAEGFSVIHSVLLYNLLRDAALAKPECDWGRFITAGVKEKTLDIEGVCFVGDTLLLGCKNPKRGNNSVLLGIAKSGDMFKSNTLDPEQLLIWREFPLYDSVSGTFCGVSDLYMHASGILAGVATGVVKRHGMEEDVGLLWNYDTRTATMKVIWQFAGVKPEGIAFNESTGDYSIVFDNGSKNPSYYMKIKAPQ